jgi:germination protein YpeB
MVKLSNEINRYSNAAMANLGQLPLSNIQIDNTEKFLSQVGDFSNYLAMAYSSGKTVSPEDYISLGNLVDYGKKLEKGFEEITKNLYDGNLSVERLEKEIKKEKDVFLDDSISATEEEFVNYPSLIYDGPYSSHIDTIEYSALEGLGEVTESQAKQVLREFMGSDKYIIKSLGEKGGRLPSYMYEVYNGKPEGKNYISAEITKNGGKISWFLNNYNPKSTKISVEKAMENARNFLRVHGYDNMQKSYYDCSGNIATINFAYTQNGITMYPDLIKVKIAMDTGECIGLEAGGFLLNNKDRSQLEPQISEEDALKSVSSNAEITSSKLAVIPTDSHREILCYEFGGKIKESGRNYLIYINALTGEQEQVLLLLESENGILTI